MSKREGRKCGENEKEMDVGWRKKIRKVTWGKKITSNPTKIT